MEGVLPRIAVLAAAGAWAALGTAAGLGAQDVEMLGEHYGTRPPVAYYRMKAADPEAFTFSRGRAVRLRTLIRGGVDPLEPALRAGAAARVHPVQGAFEIPVILGLFGDTNTEPKYTKDAVQTAYFGTQGKTIHTYYSEVSGGRLTLTAVIMGWLKATASRTQLWVTNGNSGLSGRTGDFIKDLLAAAGDVDWGQFDNDGPDGIPNSGDDDGFVDVLAVLQPTPGAECGGSEQDNRIWSHRWSLRFATGSAYTTSTPAASGGMIQVDDYVIQPIFACNGTNLSEIGVFTHELGHAFGLPDLYDTNDSDGKHAGAGNWSLMAAGSWGCDGNTPNSPCHMDAWSKAVLGWATVTVVPDGSNLGDISLPGVEATGQIYRVESADGSGEYFLLENRQRTGFDVWLPKPGLLVWQIDPDWVDTYWSANMINAFDHMGVWLRQADGLNQLGRVSGGNRGDVGDPFPYEGVDRENRAFHATSNPASLSYPGTATGVTLLDIRQSGNDITLQLSNRYATVSVRSEGDTGAGGLFTVDGAPVSGPEHSFASAPFTLHEIEAAAGDILSPGIRRPFLEWTDDPDAPRIRTLSTPVEDTTLVARYGGEEVQLAMEITGSFNGIEPGTIKSSPESGDLWFPAGTTVTLEAVPNTGFGFARWTGALAGRPNPTTVTVNAPMSAGAEFELTYAVESASASIEAAVEQDIALQVDNANPPVFWSVVSGTLPQGLTLDILGHIRGAAMETGTFTVTVEARDGIGLVDRGEVTLEVVEPTLSFARLAAPFVGVGEGLTLPQQRFVDGRGNGDGAYDLGDLRAWVLSHPDLPTSAPAQAALVPPTTLTLRRGGER
ncbi:MAG: M6 family metalloprotease domain-containing protein [Gemmatimonadota bacterium]